jgi:hypothetical protein
MVQGYPADFQLQRFLYLSPYTSPGCTWSRKTLDIEGDVNYFFLFLAPLPTLACCGVAHFLP